MVTRAPKQEFSEIVRLRRDVYRIDWRILGLLLAGFALTFLNPVFAMPFGVVVFILFYQKLAKAVHQPCPQRGAPFGIEWSFPLGVGTDICQSCGVSLFEDGE